LVHFQLFLCQWIKTKSTTDHWGLLIIMGFHVVAACFSPINTHFFLKQSFTRRVWWSSRTCASCDSSLPFGNFYCRRKFSSKCEFWNHLIRNVKYKRRIQIRRNSTNYLPKPKHPPRCLSNCELYSQRLLDYPVSPPYFLKYLQLSQTSISFLQLLIYFYIFGNKHFKKLSGIWVSEQMKIIKVLLKNSPTITQGFFKGI
jgi:hypothetical protein